MKNLFAPLFRVSPIYKICLLISFILFFRTTETLAQCNNTNAYQGAAAPTCGANVQLSGCNFSGEYNTVTAVVAGENYQSTTSLGDYITIRQGTPAGAIIAFGFSPLNWTATLAGNYYVHINIDATCGADATCRTSTLTHLSPFTTLTNIPDCSTSVTATMNGTGHGWNMTGCWAGGTPGDEEVFSFTAPTTGAYSINITTATGGWVDFLWKPATAGCDNTGWNCINDVSGTGIQTGDVPMNWTAGATYYILVDPEGIGAYSYTFNMVCPPVAPTGSPGGIATSLSVWFKANKNVYSDAGVTTATNGGTVQEWDELSGNGTLTKASQTTAARKPTYLESDFNFNPVISTVHTSTQYLASPSITDTDLSGTGDITYYSVYTQTGGALNQVWNAASQSKVGFESATVYCQGDVSPGNLITMGAVTTPSVRSFQQTNATGVVNAYENNNFSATVTNDPLTIGNYFETYTIGSGAGGGWPATAKIAEIIIYGSVHNAAERNQVSSYLALKHGITLDQTTAQDYTASDGTTKMWIAANAGTFNNDIIGIGRDDDSELAQLKSKSVNADGIITLLAEAESTTNNNIPANNNFNDLADLEFLTFGNNNGAATWTTAGAPTNFEILTRKWLVHETGEVGTIQLDFDVADANFDVPAPILGNTYYLIIDTDNDGSLADEYGTALLDQGGNTWRATGVNLNDGELFTIACIRTAPGGVTTALNVWLKANVGTTPSSGSGALTNWSNLGACGSDITVHGADWAWKQAGVVNPTYNDIGYNYNPTNHFNGNYNYLSIPNNAGVTYGSFYAVAQLEDLSRDFTHMMTWYDVSSSPHADGSMHGGGNVGVAAYNLAGYNPNFANNAGDQSWRQNGNQVITTTNHTGNHDIVSAVAKFGDFDSYADRFFGGQHGEGAGFADIPERDWLGNVSELVVLGATGTNAEREQIESYLAIKYGKTLGINGTTKDYVSTNGTTIWDQSNGAAYNWDIIGIGRDDIEGLYQKQSHSEDDTTRVYLSSLQTLNSANPGTFTNDISYITVGNDRGKMHSNLVINTEVPAACGLYTRLEREWKVTKTNMTDDFGMDFTLNQNANQTAVTVSHLRLLVDNDGDFSNGGTTCYFNGDAFGTVISYNNPIITVTGISSTHIANNSVRYLTIASTNQITPLPVELTQFDIKCKNEYPTLYWTTASETNNDYFIIERSTDMENFEILDKVDGNGNSSTQTLYTWKDNNPINEQSYYRLKQTDFDGAAKNLGTIATNCKEKRKISIYPNPTTKTLFIKLGQNYEDVKIEIKNVLGQITQLNNYNSIENIELSLKGENGIYFLTISDIQNKTIHHQKIIKQ